MNELVVNLLVDKSSANCGATLPTSAYRPKENSGHNELHIRVIHYDDGVISAKLKYAPPKTISDCFGDIAAHRARARGRNTRDPPIARHSLAKLWAISHYKREDPFEANLSRDITADRIQSDRGEWRKLRGFPHHHITADSGYHRIPRPNCRWKVKGGNDPNYPKGVPLLVHAMVGPFRVHCLPIELS